MSDEDRNRRAGFPTIAEGETSEGLDYTIWRDVRSDTVQVAVGFITLSFTTQDFREFVRACGEALIELDWKE
jgi:hypothetical protein